MHLKNLVVGITGAASGIGQACAVAAAVEGADVALSIVMVNKTEENTVGGVPLRGLIRTVRV